MADLKNSGLKWNFEVNNSDDDFSDISYAPAMNFARNAETKAKDIKPETPVYAAPRPVKPAATDADQIVIQPTETNKVLKEVNQPAAQPKAKKTTSGTGLKKKKKKYISSRNKPNWTLIGIAVAAVLVIAVLVVLLWPKPEKEAEWGKESTDSAVYTQVKTYYDALKDGDALALRSVLDGTAVTESASIIGWKAQNVYEDFTRLQVHSIRGVNKGEYAVAATAYYKYYTIDTEVPFLHWLYLRPDTNGILRILTVNEYGAEDADETMQEIKHYMVTATKMEYPKNLYEEVTNELKQLMENNPDLQDRIHALSDTTETPESDTAAVVDPTAPEPTEPPTEEPTVSPWGAVARDFIGRINSGSVRLRRDPDTSDPDNVLGYFASGDKVHVIGELEKWYYIVDDAEGGRGTGKIGYVFKEYVDIP